MRNVEGALSPSDAGARASAPAQTAEERAFMTDMRTILKSHHSPSDEMPFLLLTPLIEGARCELANGPKERTKKKDRTLLVL